MVVGGSVKWNLAMGWNGWGAVCDRVSGVGVARGVVATGCFRFGSRVGGEPGVLFWG